MKSRVIIMKITANMIKSTVLRTAVAACLLLFCTASFGFVIAQDGNEVFSQGYVSKISKENQMISSLKEDTDSLSADMQQLISKWSDRKDAVKGAKVTVEAKKAAANIMPETVTTALSPAYMTAPIAPQISLEKIKDELEKKKDKN